MARLWNGKGEALHDNHGKLAVAIAAIEKQEAGASV
jgi:hypothetical protein